MVKMSVPLKWSINSTQSQSKFQQVFFGNCYADFKILMEIKKSQNDQNKSEKEQSWRAQTAWSEEFL